MNQSLAIFPGKFLREFGQNLKLNLVFFSAKKKEKKEEKVGLPFTRT